MPERPEEDALAREFPFTPILGWSTTRYDLFSICKRRYFYHYYSKYDREHPLRLILELKDLVSIPLEIGGIVHEVIAALLRRLMKTQGRFDLDRFHRFVERTTERHLRSKRFQEAYYRLLPGVEVENLLPSAKQPLERLLGSDRWQWLVSEAPMRGERWMIDPPGYGEARLGALKVFCKADFIFPSEDLYHVIDWKTGKADASKHERQLLGYAAWASHHLSVQPERIRTSVAYLNPEYSELPRAVTQADLDNFAVQVEAETREMYGYCRDVELNIPLEKGCFPRVDDPRICGQCNFRRLCFPEQHPSSGGG